MTKNSSLLKTIKLSFYRDLIFMEISPVSDSILVSSDGWMDGWINIRVYIEEEYCTNDVDTSFFLQRFVQICSRESGLFH